MFITSDEPGFSLLLSIIAKFALIRLAIALALITPPTSGETIITGLFLYFSSISFTNTGAANKLSVGISKSLVFGLHEDPL